MINVETFLSTFVFGEICGTVSFFDIFLWSAILVRNASVPEKKKNVIECHKKK